MNKVNWGVSVIVGALMLLLITIGIGIVIYTMYSGQFSLYQQISTTERLRAESMAQEWLRIASPLIYYNDTGKAIFYIYNAGKVNSKIVFISISQPGGGLLYANETNIEVRSGEIVTIELNGISRPESGDVVVISLSTEVGSKFSEVVGFIEGETP